MPFSTHQKSIKYREMMSKKEFKKHCEFYDSLGNGSCAWYNHIGYSAKMHCARYNHIGYSVKIHCARYNHIGYSAKMH